MGIYIRLVDYNSQQAKEDAFLSGSDRYVTDSANFTKIPGMPIAYWVSEKMGMVFSNSIQLSLIAEPKQGMATTNNRLFLRNWYEVELSEIGFSCPSREKALACNRKWFPYNKGGEFRKWYGNNDLVVNWEKDGADIKTVVKAKYSSASYAQGFSDEKWEKLIEIWVVKNQNSYFKECITWSFVSSSYFGVRYSPTGFIFDVGGSCVFPAKGDIFYLTGFLCSKISKVFMSIFNPTINFQVGDVKQLPIIFNNSMKFAVDEIVNQCIEYSKADWDSFETSWDFKKHPLV